MLLFWLADLIMLVAVLPIVVILMKRIVTPMDRIRKTVDDILYNGVILTGELDNVPALLAETDSTVNEVAIGATRYVKRVAPLLPS